eukprot:XP_011673439.1 PREDICTED: uncharacterized protein LOC105442729 isoform X2 [Strongylocentrotus purpuratus]
MGGLMGAGREKYDGRIDGYDGEWKLINTINIKDKIEFPIIAGYIDEYNVIINDLVSGTYMLHMNTRHTQRVITGSGGTSCVSSSALLNDDKVVCGKVIGEGCTGDSLTGCISVYDRQWKHINDVTIPKDTALKEAAVYVAVDQDGMIIAADAGESKIYVIKPADGKIMNTITCKENIMMHDLLSSGHIIAQPSTPDHRVLIIDRQGAHREIHHSDTILSVCIDPMTDDLYVVTSDDEYNTCVIDQVMSGGEMKKRRVASFPVSTELDPPVLREWLLVSSRVIMTPSGKLIANDGKNILVFKNRFTL